MGAEMNEVPEAESRPKWHKIRNIAGIVLALGVAAALVVWLARLFVQPDGRDLLFIGYYQPVNLGEEGSDTSLLVVQQDGLFGYADRDGKLVIPCQFDAASPFHEGLAAVEKNHRWGYIDSSGKIIIPYRYYHAEGFHDGYAFVVYRVDMEKPSYAAFRLIDRNGRTLKDYGYFLAVGYREGMYVAQANSFSSYFSPDGNLLLKKNCESTGIFPLADLNGDGRYEFGFYPFSGGLAKVEFTSSDYGAFFMDLQGERVIGDFLRARDFSEGLAAVQPGDPTVTENAKDGQKRPWGYVDTEGQMALPAVYEEAFPFSEGLAVVKGSDGRWAIIDRSGRETASIPGDFIQARAFREGMCAVAIEKPAGTVFSEDTPQWANTNRLWGFIDTSGKLVVPCIYEQVSDFHGGIAQVMLPDGKIGYIDRTGNYIWEPR